MTEHKPTESQAPLDLELYKKAKVKYLKESNLLEEAYCDITDLIFEIEHLREALAFYGDEKNYEPCRGLENEDCYPVVEDNGKKARQILGLTSSDSLTTEGKD